VFSRIDDFDLIGSGFSDLSTLPSGALPVGWFALVGSDVTSLEGIFRIAPETYVAIQANDLLSECEVQDYFDALLQSGYEGETYSIGNGPCN
jgi:hypothetical protein